MIWNCGAVFIVLLLTSSADAQPAQPAQPAGQPVNVLGCVSKGVEVGCLIIKDRATGKTYQINAAKPAPDPAQNLVVRLKGRTTSMMDFCQQGPVLADISWSYTKMQCPAGASK